MVALTLSSVLRWVNTVAESPLVKTAFFASDANWGRILAAIGRSGLIDLDVNNITIHLGDHLICQKARASLELC